MFDKVKNSLRISTDKFDTDIIDLIDAAKKDLKITDIKKINDADPLIIRAVILYCKGHFYLENKDADKYIKSYELLKQHLSLVGEYNHVE